MHRRNSIVRTKKKSDNSVREVRVFKFEHRAKRKTRTIWSEKSQMSETSEFSTWPIFDVYKWVLSNVLHGLISIILLLVVRASMMVENMAKVPRYHSLQNASHHCWIILSTLSYYSLSLIAGSTKSSQVP